MLVDILIGLGTSFAGVIVGVVLERRWKVSNGIGRVVATRSSEIRISGKPNIGTIEAKRDSIVDIKTES